MTIELMSGTQAAALGAQPLTYTGSLTDRGGAPDGYPTFSRTRLLAPSTDFATAVQALMTWQVQARSGLHVVASSPGVELDAVVVMSVGVGRAALRIPCRVVDVIDEPHRHGFSYGTLPGHPESGEETFVLRQHEDESVTFTVWAFSRAASPLARLGGPLTRQAQRFMTRRYLHVLDRRPRAVPGGGSRSSLAG